MAFSSVVLAAGYLYKVVNVTATADADTGGDVLHGFVNPNTGAALTQAQADLIQAIPTNLLQAPAALSLWAVTVKAPTLITLVKATTAGSGNAGAQIQLYIFLPNNAFTLGVN